MKERYIHILGIVLTAVYGLFIVFLYAAEPRSLSEISSKARTTIGSAANKGQIIIGTYAVDPALFNDGLTAFRSGNFVSALDLFERADPEKRDPATQYYIAYSFYRQGWGRISNDDELFQKGFEAVDRVIALDNSYRAADSDLQLKTPAELKNELQEGLRVTADDFNPLRLIRERK